MLLRLALAMLTEGTSDAAAIERYARETVQWGYIVALESDGDLNFPPLAMSLAAGTWKLSQTIQMGFPHLLKVWIVLSDLLSIALVWRIGCRIACPRFGQAAAVFLAWNPLAIVLSGYHCNIDPMYAAMGLLAVELMLCGRFLWCGLVLGLAVNLKLIPVLLVIPLVLQCRTRQHAAGLVGGLAIMSPPGLWALAASRETFLNHVLLYRSHQSDWGINFILLNLMHRPEWSALLDRVATAFSQLGTALMILVILLLSLRLRRRDDRTPLHAATAGAIAFLLFTPGFGVQYMAFVIPMMTLLAPRLTMAFGTIAAAGIVIGILLRDHFIFHPPVLFVAWSVLWIVLTKITGSPVRAAKLSQVRTLHQRRPEAAGIPAE